MFKVAFSDLEVMAKAYNMKDPIVDEKKTDEDKLIATTVMNFFANRHDGIFFGDNAFAIHRQKEMDISVDKEMDITYDSNIKLMKYLSDKREYEVFLNQNVYIRQDDINDCKNKLMLNIKRYNEAEVLKHYIVKLSEITLTIEKNISKPHKTFTIDGLINLSANIKKGLEDLYYFNFNYNIEFGFFPRSYDYYKIFKINHSMKDYKFDEKLPLTNKMAIKRYSEQRNIFPIIVTYINYLINGYKWCENIRNKKEFHVITNFSPIVISTEINKLFSIIDLLLKLPNELKYYYICYMLMDNIGIIAEPYVHSIGFTRADTDLSKFSWIYRSQNKLYLRVGESESYENQTKAFMRAHLAEKIVDKKHYYVASFNLMRWSNLPYKKLDFMLETFFNYFTYVFSNNTYRNNFYSFSPFKPLNEYFYVPTKLNHGISEHYNSSWQYDGKG